MARTLNLFRTKRLRISLALFSVFGATAGTNVQSETKPPAYHGILESWEVDLETRSIFYNRVEAPVLKPQPKLQQAPVEAASEPTAEELAWIKEWESKRNVFMFLSCTVYDREVTNVSWWHEGGEYVLWSSIDFNYLRGLFDFETPESRYSVFMGIGDETRQQIRERNDSVENDPEMKAYSRKEGIDLSRPLPPRQIPGATPAHSTYQFVSLPKTGVDPEITRARAELHRYFEANREQLVHDFQTSEAARIAHEQWMKENPPVPQDTTISFFPIKSLQTSKAKSVRKP